MAVGFEHILAVGAAALPQSKRRLQRDDGFGALVGVGDSGKRQDLDDMRAIGGEDGEVFFVAGDVIGAVGQAKTALQHIGGIVVRIVEARRHPQAENVVGVEIGVVQGIDIGANAAPQGTGQRPLVIDRRDGIELGLEWA